MKTLLAFDVDGVFSQTNTDLETFSGPVDPVFVKQLEDNGYIISIVSPSPNYPKVYSEARSKYISMFPMIMSNRSRTENLEITRLHFEKIHGEMNRFYISDNGDKKDAIRSGFIYLEPEEFIKIYERVL
jgi:hypothetical protein